MSQTNHFYQSQLKHVKATPHATSENKNVMISADQVFTCLTEKHVHYMYVMADNST